MSKVLYPFGYGTRLVDLETIKEYLRFRMHPEAFRRTINFIIHQGGKFGPGGARRVRGGQPNKPGFALEGQSFHQDQNFPSGLYYTAVDWVVVNPGHKHRAPNWDEVPKQGSLAAIQYGYHMNVGGPGEKGAESWHGQPIELDGWSAWVDAGRPDLDYSYQLAEVTPRQQPPQPPVPSTQPSTSGVIVQIKSRYLKEGAVGNDVKFFQRQLNEIAGQSLLIDGYYGPKTKDSVRNWQAFFKKTSDGIVLPLHGELDNLTQKSIIEVSLLTA